MVWDVDEHFFPNVTKSLVLNWKLDVGMNIGIRFGVALSMTILG